MYSQAHHQEQAATDAADKTKESLMSEEIAMPPS
jgi:hypothetical protein